MDIGSTITSLRKSKSITQGDLAKSSNITQAYLSQIENNKKEPNLSTLKDISFSLGIPLPVIFFMSLEKDDVPEHKQEFFNTMKPTLSGFFESIFNNDAKANN